MNKVGRNDPCPCGSGKKFKKCCEALSGKKTHSFAITQDEKATKLTSLFAKQTFFTAPEKKIEEGVEKNSTNPCE